MSTNTPEGWTEVFRGACLEADLVVAVLDASAVRAVRQQQSAENLWPGTILEDCRVYVPTTEAEAARRALAEREPLGDADEPEG
jgi:hypothetical protein